MCHSAAKSHKDRLLSGKVNGDGKWRWPIVCLFQAARTVQDRIVGLYRTGCTGSYVASLVGIVRISSPE